MLFCSFLCLCTNEEERHGGREYLVLFAGVDLNRVFVHSVNLLFLANIDVSYNSCILLVFFPFLKFL